MPACPTSGFLSKQQTACRLPLSWLAAHGKRSDSPAGVEHGARARERFVSLAVQAGLDAGAPLERLNRAVAHARDASFVELDSGDAGLVQLMNFSQTKGREADAVILSYSGSDWYGYDAAEPFDEPSRLLYVSLTRARERVVVLLPTDPHPLVAPFLNYA